MDVRLPDGTVIQNVPDGELNAGLAAMFRVPLDDIDGELGAATVN